MVSFILLNYLRFFLVPVLVVHILYFRWYAKRFLHPDVVASYEYIFVWDEDRSFSLGSFNIFFLSLFLSVLWKSWRLYFPGRLGDVYGI